MHFRAVPNILLLLLVFGRIILLKVDWIRIVIHLHYSNTGCEHCEFKTYCLTLNLFLASLMTL